eukprot:gene23617-30624_t
MLSRLHEHWPALKAKHNMFVSHEKFSCNRLTNDQSLKSMFDMFENTTTDIHLYVNMNSQVYSWYAKHHDMALERIHSSELLIVNTTFALDESISEEKYDIAVNVLCADLFDRIRVLDLEHLSEYSMRDIISPILVRALCLVDDFNGHRNETKVRLTCNKLVSGSSGHGSIDYVMSYLNVLIAIGEAKKFDNIWAGLHQNLAEQYNALESLADKIVGSSIVGSKRSIDFAKVMSSLRSLGTYGITTTGKEWLFSRTEPYSRDASRVRIFKSQVHELIVSRTASAVEKMVMRGQVKVLLRVIVAMIFNQKAAVDGNKSIDMKGLQTKIGAEEYNSHVMATEALALAIVNESDDDECESDDENESDHESGTEY